MIKVYISAVEELKTQNGCLRELEKKELDYLELKFSFSQVLLVLV